MTINQAGLELIKSFEGLRLTVYKDMVGLLTVGYGHRTDLDEGVEITQENADQLLRDDLKKFEDGVDNLVNVDLNDNQFSALVSFAYNLGLGSLRSSTLLRCINKNNFDVGSEFFEVGQSWWRWRLRWGRFLF